MSNRFVQVHPILFDRVHKRIKSQSNNYESFIINEKSLKKVMNSNEFQSIDNNPKSQNLNKIKVCRIISPQKKQQNQSEYLLLGFPPLKNKTQRKDNSRNILHDKIKRRYLNMKLVQQSLEKKYLPKKLKSYSTKSKSGKYQKDYFPSKNQKHQFSSPKFPKGISQKRNHHKDQFSQNKLIRKRKIIPQVLPQKEISDSSRKILQFVNVSSIKIDNMKEGALLKETQFAKQKNSETPTPPHQKDIEFEIPSMGQHSNFEEFIAQYKPENQEIQMNILKKSSRFEIKENKEVNSLYFGEIEQDKKEGKGIFINKKIQKEGIWRGDQLIQGVEKTKNYLYKGSFKDGKRQGKGQYHWKNGQFYSGDWKNGKKHGYGFWKSSSGDSYLGQWMEGMAEGFGILSTKNGSVFSGQFHKFQKSGSGRQNFMNGDIFEGQYLKGVPHGQGKYKWKDGSKYEGEFFQGLRHGEGTILLSGGNRYTGNFIKQRFNGDI